MDKAVTYNNGQWVIVLPSDQEFEKYTTERSPMDSDDIYMESRGYTRYGYNDLVYELDNN